MDVFKRFLAFVEISTKLASQTPFFIGVAYALHLSGKIELGDTALLWVAVFMFDLPVTMINNYLDKRRAKEKPHFGKAASLAMIFGTIAISLSIGLWLSWKYGLCFLAGGAVCFAAGIFYSATPISISRTPYGEIVSGLVQGFTIIYLVVFVNLPAGYLAQAQLDWTSLSFNANIWNLARLGLVTLPAVFCISNIMLANNTCDVERDVKIQRYTLPYFIGKKAAIAIYKLLYAAAYASMIASVISRTLSPVTLLALASFPLVWKNVKVFEAEQVKSKTFATSIKNFVQVLFPYMATIFIGAIFR
jgi:1,4-dihydroxy-2-naphthoate octaprenyltransferase